MLASSLSDVAGEVCAVVCAGVADVDAMGLASSLSDEELLLRDTVRLMALLMRRLSEGAMTGDGRMMTMSIAMCQLHPIQSLADTRRQVT